MALLLLGALLACRGGDKGTDDSDTNPETGQGHTGETADTSPPEFPEDPRPLTLTVSGAYEGTLVFDAPTCTWLETAPNFRAFWRNSEGAHVFVLVADILSVFDGPGTYTEADGSVRVKLQEEAGGSGYYFGTDASVGDTASITVTSVDDAQAWGEFTFSGLHSDSGAITVTPVPVPIWCPTMNGD